MRTAGTVLYIVKHAKNANDALRLSIDMGGDIDSLAAIAVGLVGGRVGLGSLPPFLLEGLEDRERIRALARGFLPTAHCQSEVARLAH